MPLPPTGRLAGIDFGTVRIGVAICDPARQLASPYENYNRRTLPLDTQYFQRLAKEERLAGFVVGLPVHMSGEESAKSHEARLFGKWLSEITQLPVVFHDERLSSAIAEDILNQAEFTKKQRKARLDKLAAQIILASYLERTAHATFADTIRPLEDGSSS
jgi:putative Holliday junction resolvase